VTLTSHAKIIHCAAPSPRRGNTRTDPAAELRGSAIGNCGGQRRNFNRPRFLTSLKPTGWQVAQYDFGLPGLTSTTKSLPHPWQTLTRNRNNGHNLPQQPMSKAAAESVLSLRNSTEFGHHLPRLLDPTKGIRGGVLGDRDSVADCGSQTDALQKSRVGLNRQTRESSNTFRLSRRRRLPRILLPLLAALDLLQNRCSGPL
jgi:hypothetical protein